MEKLGILFKDLLENRLMDCILGDGRDVEVRGRTRSVMKVQKKYPYCQIKYAVRSNENNYRFNCNAEKLLEYLRAGGAVIFICLNNNADHLGTEDIIGAYFCNPSNEALRLALGTKLPVGHLNLVPFSKRNSNKNSLAAVFTEYFIDLSHENVDGWKNLDEKVSEFVNDDSTARESLWDLNHTNTFIPSLSHKKENAAMDLGVMIKIANLPDVIVERVEFQKGDFKVKNIGDGDDDGVLVEHKIAHWTGKKQKNSIQFQVRNNASLPIDFNTIAVYSVAIPPKNSSDDQLILPHTWKYIALFPTRTEDGKVFLNSSRGKSNNSQSKLSVKYKYNDNFLSFKCNGVDVRVKVINLEDVKQVALIPALLKEYNARDPISDAVSEIIVDEWNDKSVKEQGIRRKANAVTEERQRKQRKLN